MKQLHINLNDESPAIRWADAQADKIGARGHVGTHLDCYTRVPEKTEYEIAGIVVNCKAGASIIESVKDIASLKNKALILYTGNLENNQYGTEAYFNEKTFLSEETLNVILEKKPLFIIIDSHGIAEKGKRHISFDKICEAKGCHVIENVDLSLIKDQKSICIRVLIDIHHLSTGKPCELYYMD